MADFGGDVVLKTRWANELLDKVNHSDLFVKGAFKAEYRNDIEIPGVPTQIGIYPMLISQMPPQGAQNVEGMVLDTRSYTMFFDKIAPPSFTYAMALESAVAFVMQTTDNWAHFRNLNMNYGVEIGYVPPQTEGITHSGLIL